jgi:hypothetical protein
MSEKEILKFEPTFENGGFWEYYKDLERQFENFLEYVPYLEGNKKTYSFRLASLILSLGAHIDSAFKEVAKFQDFSDKYPRLRKKAEKGKTGISDYFPLAQSYQLSEREVRFKCLPNGITVIPFKDYLRKKKRVSTPYWWRVYNKVKHQFSDNFKKATLRTTRDALAAAFLLNAIHTPSATRLAEFGLVKSKITTEPLNQPDLKVFKENLEKRRGYWGSIETPLFIYDYEQ